MRQLDDMRDERPAPRTPCWRPRSPTAATACVRAPSSCRCRAHRAVVPGARRYELVAEGTRGIRVERHEGTGDHSAGRTSREMAWLNRCLVPLPCAVHALHGPGRLGMRRVTRSVFGAAPALLGQVGGVGSRTATYRRMRRHQGNHEMCSATASRYALSIASRLLKSYGGACMSASSRTGSLSQASLMNGPATRRV